MKAKEIRDLSADEIGTKLRESREQLLHMRLHRETGKLEKTHEVRALRKTIARLETIRLQKTAATAK
jgi:large subunit ribosomal protein L29